MNPWGWHGSLEGFGGLKTNEAYHSKADASLIPDFFFFENLTTPFFGNVCFIMCDSAFWRLIIIKKKIKIKNQSLMLYQIYSKKIQIYIRRRFARCAASGLK